MEAALQSLITNMPLFLLFILIAIFIYTLAKGADILVDEAVNLSLRWGIPKMLIGATIVSIGTTLPEAAVSVFAAVQGHPGLALGNAVGSIICDTGLILGLAALLSPLPLIASVVNRQGWIQLGAGLVLVLFAIPFSNINRIFQDGGRLPQWAGFVFLAGLGLYLYYSITGVKKNKESVSFDVSEMDANPERAVKSVLKLILGIAMVVISSRVLIPMIQESAVRLYVPESIIAATLVAFGTSLPELVTALTAVRKGHAGLAVGNVIGADILNVLFVAGAAAAVTPAGLAAPVQFFRFLFPAMLLILVVFRIGIRFSRDSLKRPFGVVLLGIYCAVTLLGYLLKTPVTH